MSYILARLREPSTYAGIAVFVAALTFIPHAAEISKLIPTVGVVIAGLIAIFAPEAKK